MAGPEEISETTTIPVFGASCYIGTNLVRYLRERGLRVKAAARSKAVLQARGNGAMWTASLPMR